MERANELSANESARAIAAGRLTCEALVRACLERVCEREATVGAWAHIDAGALTAAARAIDQAGPQAPLFGLPVGVKDIIDTADQPTAYGSPIYAGHTPASDAACVALIKECGGLIAGKTVTTEFATRHAGKTANPHNPAHTPGGSSSGSAAAVADFMVPLAFGTQTTGSHIRPASYCGIVGYKPTFGTINRTGLKPLSDSQDTIGVYGRTVADTALLVAALSGRDLSLSDGGPGSALTVGVYETPHRDLVQPEMAEAMEMAGRLFGAGGHRVRRAELPAAFREMADTQEAINDFESWRSLAYERLIHAERLTPTLRRKLEKGGQCTRERYEGAQRKAEECRLRLDDVFGEYDALIAPAAPGEAPKGLESTGNPIFSQIWNILHVPSITVPIHRGPSGLPLGVQLIGRRHGDRKLLVSAAWLEERIGARLKAGAPTGAPGVTRSPSPPVRSRP